MHKEDTKSPYFTFFSSKEECPFLKLLSQSFDFITDIFYHVKTTISKKKAAGMTCGR